MSSTATAAATTFATYFSSVLATCSPQVAAYGTCLQASGATLTQGACAAEFASLRACSQASLAKLRLSRPRR